MTSVPSTRWGPDDRAPFFGTWWRALVTLAAGLLPVAVTPYLVSAPAAASWVGPLSLAPIAGWLLLGFRRRARRPSVAAGPSGGAEPPVLDHG
ncbi:MAG TPA: hypothetical protein VGK35_03540 [Actinotalea sp.]